MAGAPLRRSHTVARGRERSHATTNPVITAANPAIDDMKKTRHHSSSGAPSERKAKPTARPAIPTPAPASSASTTPERYPGGRSTPTPPPSASAKPIRNIEPYIVRCTDLSIAGRSDEGNNHNRTPTPLARDRDIDVRRAAHRAESAYDSSVPPTTRLFARLDESRITDEARAFFETTVDFRAILIHTLGTRRPPWTHLGIATGGGSVGHVEFATFTEAKRAAERYFGSAMGGWQEPPRDVEPVEYVASKLPGYLDWRIGTEPVERQPLYRAKLSFSEYVAPDDHEHCFSCFGEFFVSAGEPARHGEPEFLLYGFRTDDGNTWVCEQCYYAVRHILEFTAEVP